MARLATLGFEPGESHGSTQPQWMSEVGDVMSAANSSEFTNTGFSDFSGVPYLGVGSCWTDQTAANGNYVILGLANAPTTGPLYARGYVQMPSAKGLASDPTSYGILALYDATNIGISVGMSKGAGGGFKIFRYTAAGTFTTITVPATISEDQYYRVEVMAAFASLASPGTNAWEVRVDDVTIASGNDLYYSAAPIRWEIGQGGGSSQGHYGQLDYDDCALNDGSGANQNSWCGPGKVWYLSPIADNARGTNWLAGAGATTGLWDALNIPGAPGGLATPTNTSQIKNAAKDTSGLYDALLPTYSVAGIPSDHTVSFCQVIGRASASATGISLGIQCVNNPVIAETVRASLPVVANEWSAAGWQTFTTAFAHNPSVALGTAPVLRVRKGTSSTTAVYLEELWLRVETIPPTPPTPDPIRVVGHAVRRAATWMQRRDRIYVPRLWTPADPLPA